jgi:hypothetical protein
MRYLGVEVDDAIAISEQVGLEGRPGWLVRIAPAIPLPQRLGFEFADDYRSLRAQQSVVCGATYHVSANSFRSAFAPCSRHLETFTPITRSHRARDACAKTPGKNT